MKRVLSRLTPALAIVCAFVVTAQAATGVVAESADKICPLLPGMKAPEVSFRQLDGNPVSLRNLIAEKPVILIFYRGGW
jgi:hypothetical protein